MKLHDWIAGHANRTPSKVAMIDWSSGRRFTYAQMHRRVGSLAGFLAEEKNIQCGDRVAVLCDNTTDIFEIQFACARVGAVFAPLNAKLAVRELEAIIGDLAPRILFHGTGYSGFAHEMLDLALVESTVEMAHGKPSGAYETATAYSHGIEAGEPPDVDEIWTILYTSGTTGRAKGVEVTYAMALMNAVNLAPLKPSSQMVNLTFLPLFHIGGLNALANPAFLYGGTVVVMRNADPSEILALIGRQDLGITHFVGVPTIFQFMAQQAAFQSTDFSQIVAAVVGGAPISAERLAVWEAAGLPLAQIYGLTETGPPALLLDPSDATGKIGSAGKPVSHISIRLVDDAGRDAADGSIGEIWLKGPGVTPGYWRRPDVNSVEFTDGWLRTGDAALRDAQGFYFIKDRFKNMYISGGENVYPAEVEAAILKLEEVLEVAVIGIPDERWGETGRAFIVKKPRAALTPECILEHCKIWLARYKHPSQIRFIDEMPHNSAGKVLKSALDRT